MIDMMCNNVLRAFCLILCLSCTATALRAELSILNVLAPTAAKCDGEIEVLAEGTAGPFTVSISGYGRPDQTEFSGVNGAVVFNNLCGGNYTITIINALGCELELQTYLERCVIELFPLEIMLPTNPSSTDGKLVVAPIEEGDYLYEWNTGQVGNTLVDLAPGDYTVTVSKNDRCSQVQTFTLEACLTSGEVEDPIPPDFDIALRGGLGFLDSDVIECNVQLREEGSSAYTDNFSSDYSIDWFLDGNLIASGVSTILVDKEEAFDPQVAPEITVKVSNGCMTKMYSRILFICGGGDQYDAEGFFIVSKDKVCAGEKGGIVLTIPNPNQDIVSVRLDGGSNYLSDGGQEDLIYLSINGISTGTHDLEINIGGCENNIEFSIESEVTQREFIRLEEFTCFFNEFCGDVPLGGELQTAATFDFSNATTRPCLIPLLCDQEVRGYKSYSYKRIRVLAYQELIRAVVEGNTIYPTSFGIAAQEHGVAAGRNLCDRVRFCPATLEIVGEGSGPWDGQAQGVTEVNGCLVMNCPILGIANNIVICPDDLGIPDEMIIGNQPPTISSCHEITMNFFEAIQAWKNGEFSHVPDFEDKELYRDLIEADLEQREEVYCATISFCATDFTVRRNNINEIDCSSFGATTVACGSPEDIGVGNTYALGSACTPRNFKYDEQTGELVSAEVYCRNSDAIWDECLEIVNIKYYPIVPWPPGHGPGTGQGLQDPAAEWRHTTKYYTNHITAEKLQNFGLSINNGRKVPIGLIKGTKNNYLSQNYAHFGNKIFRNKAIASDWLIDDWDKEEIIFIENVTKEAKDKLVFVSDSIRWTRDIRANRYLEISHLSKTESSIWVGGLFKGYLAIDKTSVEHVSNPSAFLMEVDYAGVVKGIEVIQGVDTSSLVKFEEMGENGIVLAGRYQEGGLLINSQNVPMQGDAGIFLLQKKKEEGFQKLVAIPSSPAFEFIDLAVAPSTKRFTLAINGKEEGFGKMDEVDARLASGFTLLTINAKGELIWSTSTNSRTFDLTHLDLTYGRDRDDLFLGLTFYEQLHWQGQYMNSEGEDDVALLKWGSNGELQWGRRYGTRDSENVSQLLFEENTLFFGGEFSGSEPRREIGRYEFVNPFAPEAKAYMSYVFDEDPTQSNMTQVIADTDLKYRSFSFQAYPNPFEDVLHLEIQGDDSKELLIELQDLLGRTFMTQNYEMVVGRQNLTLKISDAMPDGVYQIRISSVDKVGVEPQIQKLIHISR